MSGCADPLRESVVRYCSQAGSDPLLVQGAGGNVSWKDEDILWIKASGTWLSEAAEREIFLPVDLTHLRTAIEAGDFAPLPRVRSNSALRPSIETLLHALMPHRVVLHLHPVEILSHLVRDCCQSALESLLGASVSWAMVDYYRPGAALAAAVSAVRALRPDANVIFLKNHGVVVGGEDVEEAGNLLDLVIARLTIAPYPNVVVAKKPVRVLNFGGRTYEAVDGEQVQGLAFPGLFYRLKDAWALYPDHVVFLGAQPVCYDSLSQLSEELSQGDDPELFFLKGEGVFAARGFSAAKKAQLQCFHDVLVRQPEELLLRALDEEQVAELLDWDAERYRQSVAKL